MSLASSSASFSLGELFVSPPDGQVMTESSLPLEHIDVQGQVIGTLASFALIQRFANPWTEPVELTYRFAIPDHASLAELAIQIGDRWIIAEIAPRQEAATLFQEALAQGRRAALSTEERPNLYTIQIGNVQSGETIIATYRYSMTVGFEGGRFELALPFGLTPRYHRISEDLKEAMRTTVVMAPSGAPIAALDLTVAIDAGVAIADPESPSHRIEVTRLDDRRCLVKLVEPRLPNQDFVLRYPTRDQADEIASSAWLARAGDEDLLFVRYVCPDAAKDRDHSSRAT